MIKAHAIGKTILVWKNLNENQANELINALHSIINNYVNLNTNISIPILLKQKFHYLVVVSKGENVILSASKINTNKENNFLCSPILNGDFLYESLAYIKDCQKDMEMRLHTSKQMPYYEWVNLISNKSFDSYLLSPNMNPEDFIKSLQTNQLSNMQMQFLKDVGIALQENNNSLTIETPEQRDDI